MKSALIARQIETNNNLTKGSYQPKGQITEIDILTPGSGHQSESIESAEQVIYQGNVIFVFNDFSDTDVYYSPVITNPTVAQLQEQLDNGIKATESFRTFLETLMVLDNIDKYIEVACIENEPETKNAIFIVMETCQ